MDKLQQIIACGTGHKRLDDDLFKTVDELLRIYRREGIFEIEEQVNEPEKTTEFKCRVHGCKKDFTSLSAYDSHYNSNHRFTCIYCRKLLQSAHFLDMHLSETHDNFFLASSNKKPMYKCFTETCDILFWNSVERNDHCIQIHKIPKTFLQQFKTKKNKKPKPEKIAQPSGLEAISDLSMVVD
ncbi:Zinc finger C2H2-type [Cinara cedri]|uniref:Zinc finger C2H2-type n=1 Tax=Cinara cedri TaxID=506608 RepID=A0A5E4MDQ6_9HEMI|nr:Zinc finger C2H2-type [Cinara cedri]